MKEWVGFFKGVGLGRIRLPGWISFFGLAWSLRAMDLVGFGQGFFRERGCRGYTTIYNDKYITLTCAILSVCMCILFVNL